MIGKKPLKMKNGEEQFQLSKEYIFSLSLSHPRDGEREEIELQIKIFCTFCITVMIMILFFIEKLFTEQFLQLFYTKKKKNSYFYVLHFSWTIINSLSISQ